MVYRLGTFCSYRGANLAFVRDYDYVGGLRKYCVSGRRTDHGSSLTKQVVNFGSVKRFARKDAMRTIRKGIKDMISVSSDKTSLDRTSCTNLAFSPEVLHVFLAALLV